MRRVYFYFCTFNFFHNTKYRLLGPYIMRKKYLKEKIDQTSILIKNIIDYASA